MTTMPGKTTRRRQVVRPEGEAAFHSDNNNNNSSNNYDNGIDETDPLHDPFEDDDVEDRNRYIGKYHHRRNPRLPWFESSRSLGGSATPCLCCSHRTALTISVCLAMVGIAGGIITLTFAMLAPSHPVPRFLVVERSGTDPTLLKFHGDDYTPTAKDNNNILGARPPPPDDSERRYVSSFLESYVMEHGRNASMGFDIQIRKPSTEQLEAATSNSNLRSPVLELLSEHPLLSGNGKRHVPNTYVDYTDPRNINQLPSGCDLYFDKAIADEDFRYSVHDLRLNLQTYQKVLDDWIWEPPALPNQSGQSSFFSGLWGSTAEEKIGDDDLHSFEFTSSGSSSSSSEDSGEVLPKPDIRKYFDATESNREEICDTLELHPEGMTGIFTQPTQLSKITASSSSNTKTQWDYYSKPEETGGIFLEPLLPPLRHPEFCNEYRVMAEKKRAGAGVGRGMNGMKKKNKNEKKQPSSPVLPFQNGRLLDAGFIVHDFASLCREKVRKTGATVLVDLGASIPRSRSSTTLDLIRLYEKFGFVFDHIYGYEGIPEHPKKVFAAIPDDLKPAYHWYNVGIDANSDGSYKNPLAMVAKTFAPQDFVVVKLQLGLDASLATALADQLLDDPRLREVVDVLYFEHPVAMKELAVHWGDSMTGSMQDSMEFFKSLREHGIAAHYWV